MGEEDENHSRVLGHDTRTDGIETEEKGSCTLASQELPVTDASERPCFHSTGGVEGHRDRVLTFKICKRSDLSTCCFTILEN